MLGGGVYGVGDCYCAGGYAGVVGVSPARRLNRGYCCPAFLLRSRCSRRFFCRLSRRELLRFWGRSLISTCQLFSAEISIILESKPEAARSFTGTSSDSIFCGMDRYERCFGTSIKAILLTHEYNNASSFATNE